MSRDKKITRHTIDSGEQQPFFFLGVVSAEPDYRLSVMINRQLGTDLRKSQEDIIIKISSEILSFSRFSATDPVFNLISNRSGGTVLLRKLRNIDYLVVPSGQPDKNAAEQLAASLRKIPEITAVFILNSQETTDRNLPLIAIH